MTLLVLDTVADLCAACVYDDQADREMGRAVRDLGKGHAEQLMTVIDDALRHAGIDYTGLNRVGVCVGPGSFTGVRVGVAAARGLALALKIPTVSINVLEALAHETRQRFPGREIISVTGRSPEHLFAALFNADGKPVCGPEIADARTLAARVDARRPVLCGSAAGSVANLASIAGDRHNEVATADIGTYARLAAKKRSDEKPPVPLYLRPPDASPRAGFALQGKES